MAVGRTKTGLLGGSFDPVHATHIALADAARSHLELDCVQLIPAGNPWQRAPLTAASKHRLAMLELAKGTRNWLTINPIEIERGGRTYTVDTLRALPSDTDYYWIMGTDQLRNFCTWRCWKEIIKHTTLVVATRPGTAPETPQSLAQHLDMLGRSIVFLPFTPSDISATQIRQQLASGNSVQGSLDPSVLRYIQQYKLYENPELTV